jgi:hypothetical protein
MGKSQNGNMGNRKRKRNMTPQNINNHTTKDLMDSEWELSKVNKW